MISMDEIRRYAQDIAERYRPASIMLFGSQARGSAHADSDVDLLVVMPFEGKGMRQAVSIRNSVKPSFPLDIIVRRPEDIESCVDRRDFFLQDIVNNGIVLYDRGNS